MGALPWLVVLALATIYLRPRKRSKLPLPPGPPADPIIGHLRHVPSESPEEKVAELSRVYGDVMYLRILNQDTIVLNTTEAAYDLLEKRSANYSDRPDFPIFKLMGWVPTLSFIGYGKTFQKHRRLLQQSFSHQNVQQYRHIQIREARRLAINLLEHPDDREAMLRRYSTAIIMRIAYGHQILSDDDPYVDIAKNSGYALSHCGPPGSTPVDLFPILQYFPSWFPGAYFAGKAREFSVAIRRMHDYPFDEVVRQMAEGTAKPSFLSYHLERLYSEHRETEEELDDLKGAAAMIYCAGADTTWSTMSSFMLAMTLHPECQVRAQKELDELLGNSRLPELNDRESLPYVECVLQECHRWLNAVPFGVPHRASEDDVYKGMFIPKGASVFANTRGISMNDAIYHDPHLFKPSRYLPVSKGGRGEPHPVAQFGFGRRICPGRHLADVNLWLAISTILTLYNVKKVIGPDGKEITPAVALSTGLTSHPKPYRCAVEMRNDKVERLVDQIRVELMSE